MLPLRNINLAPPFPSGEWTGYYTLSALRNARLQESFILERLCYAEEWSYYIQSHETIDPDKTLCGVVYGKASQFKRERAMFFYWSNGLIVNRRMLDAMQQFPWKREVRYIYPIQIVTSRKTRIFPDEEYFLIRVQEDPLGLYVPLKEYIPDPVSSDAWKRHIPPRDIYFIRRSTPPPRKYDLYLYHLHSLIFFSERLAMAMLQVAPELQFDPVLYPSDEQLKEPYRQLLRILLQCDRKKQRKKKRKN